MMNVSDKIKYVGVDDLDIDLFESQYVVPEFGQTNKLHLLFLFKLLERIR